MISKEDTFSTYYHQEHISRHTSINKNKLPASIREIEKEIQQGSVWLDIGGGKFDNLKNYFKEKEATLLILDPYNRSKEENDITLNYLKNNKVDGVMVNNVLNVILEPEIRYNIINQAKESLKENANAYFLIYEGDKSQIGKTTKISKDGSSSYQLNQRSIFYKSSIENIFKTSVKIKGSLLIVKKELLDNKENLYLNELKKYGLKKYKKVGKLIGNSIYIHKSSIDILLNEYIKANEVRHNLLSHLKILEDDNKNFDIIKYDFKEKVFVFLKTQDFDNQNEPIIDSYLKIDNKSIKEIIYKHKKPIYHHKWMFVENSYKGFNISESIKRSFDWKNKLGTNKKISSKIGYNDFWDDWLKENNLSPNTYNKKVKIYL